MKRVGWIIFSMALVLSFAHRALAPEYDLGSSVVAAFLLLGLLFVVIGIAIGLWRGQVQLRPWDALKHFAFLFPLLMAISSAIYFFQLTPRSFSELLLVSGTASIAMAFWSTAYRKPTN